ncbi:MAG: KEOPS complex kinase/ATPase Bud32 [archaeon]
MEVIYKGAEATLYKNNYLGYKTIEKERKPKEYRIEELDKTIKERRTLNESRMIKKARKAVNTPYILRVDLKKSQITMEYIEGETLKKRIQEEKEDIEKIGGEIGEQLKKLHEQNIVHNDLTTSNIMRKNSELYFIDFGLSEKTSKTEDKAVDLLVFKKMLKSTHWKEFKEIWSNLKKEYGKKPVLNRLKKIEKRARYTTK